MQHRVVEAVLVTAVLLFIGQLAGAQLPDPDDLVSDVEDTLLGDDDGSPDDSNGNGAASSDGEDMITVVHEDGGGSATQDSGSDGVDSGASGADAGSAAPDDGSDVQGAPAIGVLLAAGAVLIALVMGRRLL